MLAYLRARADERCTAIGAGMFVVGAVLYVAMRFPPAEHALVHYSTLALGTSVTAILGLVRDRALARFRDLVLLSPVSIPVQPARKDQGGMSLFDEAKAAAESEFGRIVINKALQAIGTKSPEAQKFAADFGTALAQNSMVAWAQLLCDTAEVIHELTTSSPAVPATTGAPNPAPPVQPPA